MEKDVNHNGELVATLPAGYRPAHTHLMAYTLGWDTVYVHIHSDGSVRVLRVSKEGGAT